MLPNPYPLQNLYKLGSKWGLQISTHQSEHITIACEGRVLNIEGKIKIPKNTNILEVHGNNERVITFT